MYLPICSMDPDRYLPRNLGILDEGNRVGAQYVPGNIIFAYLVVSLLPQIISAEVYICRS